MAELCIIPARGGSKRIPRKNVKEFAGRPIISYVIELARKAGIFEEIMVSTDDDEIADIAVKNGAKVPFRRTLKNSDDFASTIDVLHEVAESYESIGKTFSNICCIYPTSPLVQVKDLLAGYRQLTDTDCDVVFPVVAFSYPIWRGLRILKDDGVEMLWPEHLNSRSQDLEKVYHDAGQWYWIKSECVLRREPLYGSRSKAIILDEMMVQDIDTPEDWQIAEIKYKLINP